MKTMSSSVPTFKHGALGLLLLLLPLHHRFIHFSFFFLSTFVSCQRQQVIIVIIVDIFSPRFVFWGGAGVGRGGGGRGGLGSWQDFCLAEFFIFHGVSVYSGEDFF